MACVVQVNVRMAPVHFAAHSNHVEELRRLLDEDPQLIEAEGPHAPLYYACGAGSLGARGFSSPGALM